jgi:hypothetical protein
MTRSRLSVALVVLVLLVSGVAGCGGSSSPTAPTQSALNVSGTWVESPGSSPMRFSLAQSGNSITGNYTLASWSGTVSGTSTGNNVSLTLTPSNPADCGAAFTGTVTGTRMTGTIVYTNCTVSGGVTTTFVKQ